MNVIVDSLSIYHRIHMNTDIEAAVYLSYGPSYTPEYAYGCWSPDSV